MTSFPLPWNQNWLHSAGRASAAHGRLSLEDRKKPTLRRRFLKPVVDTDDDFELDFQGFEDDDESDIDEEDDVLGFRGHSP